MAHWRDRASKKVREKKEGSKEGGKEGEKDRDSSRTAQTRCGSALCHVANPPVESSEQLWAQCLGPEPGVAQLSWKPPALWLPSCGLCPSASRCFPVSPCLPCGRNPAYLVTVLQGAPASALPGSEFSRPFGKADWKRPCRVGQRGQAVQVSAKRSSSKRQLWGYSVSPGERKQLTME